MKIKYNQEEIKKKYYNTYLKTQQKIKKHKK